MTIEVELGGGTAQPPAEQGTSGVESRINELTAKWRETERQLGAVAVENKMLKEMVAMQQAVRPPAAPPPDPMEGLSDEQKQLAAVFNRMLDQRLQPLQAQVQVTQVSRMAQDVGLSPREREAAEALYNNWMHRGIPANPEDAVRSVIGTLNFDERLAAQRSAAARAGQGQPNVLTNGNPLPQQPQQPQEQPFPDDYDTWDHEKQYLYMAKRVGHIK